MRTYFNCTVCLHQWYNFVLCYLQYHPLELFCVQYLVTFSFVIWQLLINHILHSRQIPLKIISWPVISNLWVSLMSFFKSVINSISRSKTRRTLRISRDNNRGIDGRNGRLRLAFLVYGFHRYRRAGSDSDIQSLCWYWGVSWEYHDTPRQRLHDTVTLWPLQELKIAEWCCAYSI